MLSEETLERLSERLVNRIESLNTFMIKKLGEQLYDIGTLTPSQLREVMQSVKYGNNLDEIINKIAEITDKNVNDIYEIFEEVAKINQNYAKQFYEYKNIKFIPYEQNKELQKQVKAIAKVTANEYVNISKTMAYMQYNELGVKEFTPISRIYQEITDKAILNISQGRESYNMVIKQAMKELTSKGIRTVDYANGYSRRADSSIRMNILDGVKGLSMELQKQFGEEFGADGVEVSHHKNPAPDHEDTVDGKQFSKEEFEKINESLIRKVGELNCLHMTYEIVLGVSKPLYSKKELEEEKEANHKGFEFEGKHYTNYEGTQLQRRIETKIREYKDRQIGAKAINDMDEVYHCQEKITQLTQKYKELSDVSGLPTKVERMRVEGYRKVNIKENIALNNYNDVTKNWINEAKPNSHKIQEMSYFEHDGIKYKVDGKNIVLDYSDKEKEIAKWLESTFGGELYMVPRINNPDGIKTPDYLFRGNKWDLKTISGNGKQVLYHSVYKKSKQSNNFIFDTTSSKLNIEDIKLQVDKLYKRTDIPFVNEIIVKKGNDFLIFKRK